MSTADQKRWYKKTKRNIVIAFGGKCCICGYCKCQDSFDLHHIDPSNKSFTISGFKIKNRKKIYEEAKKCVMLCANCHREFHAGLVTINKPIYFDESKIPIEVKTIITTPCEVCGKNTKNSRFCCPKCTGIFYSKSKLTDEKLLELVKTMSYVEIGKLHNVSEAAIRKRHKKIKLSLLTPEELQQFIIESKMKYEERLKIIQKNKEK
jgi:hypothetical protein